QLTTSILLHNAVSFFAYTDSDVAEGGSLILQRKATFASANGTDTLTFAGVMDLDSNANVTTGGSVTLVVNTPTEISGAITGDPSYGILTGGSMSLVKSGSARLTLSGGNQYLGNFTVVQGTLLLGSAGALGINDEVYGAFAMNSLTVSSGGVLDLGGFTPTASTLLILSGTGAGSGALTNSGADASTYSGSLALAAASSIGGAGDIILSGSAASAYNLTKLGPNTLTFGGTSTFSGSLQASVGVTTISSTGTFEFTSTGGLVGNLTNDGVLRFNNSADRTVAGTISGTGSLVKVGTYNLTLPGSTYTGTTTISAGSLTVKGALSTSQISNAGTFNWSPTNSVFTGSLSGSGKTILSSTSAMTLTLGTLGVTPTFDGNIQIGSNVTLAVNAGARLPGSIEVLSGGAISLATGVGNVFGSTAKLTVNGGVVDLKGNTVSVGSLTLLNGGTFISSSGTAKITFSGGTLSVAPSSLVITSQPQSQTVIAGSSAVFSISASGTGPLSYQWKKDGTTILTGGTSSTYTIPAATATNAGSYSVVVTNSSGGVSSGSATLTVNTPVSITSQPASVTVTNGSSASFSVTATGTAPFTYQWKKDGSSITGGTSSTYSIPAATATNAGTYSVVVTNLLGSVSSASATLSVNTPVSITGQPASATVTAGSSATFSVTATGTGPISYQWKKGNSLITAGTGATYTIASAVDSDAGIYSVLVSNLLGSVSSG
ncbi:MAG: immunoglobulin domain-containing protein, partial [Chthoniobacteraceae bacterium]|nr:immunoglobulin domain-containing protein [Chthoniobacteraceae bacterium]